MNLITIIFIIGFLLISIPMICVCFFISRGGADYFVAEHKKQLVTSIVADVLIIIVTVIIKKLFIQ
jgi:uncharacterized SAM-binding protein YcdF (DUF218 family)